MNFDVTMFSIWDNYQQWLVGPAGRSAPFREPIAATATWLIVQLIIYDQESKLPHSISTETTSADQSGSSVFKNTWIASIYIHMCYFAMPIVTGQKD
jgi:hypothetical protein